MGTNPFNIPIGTSDPVSLCSGLPLLSALGTARAGVSGTGRSYTLIDESITILITRLKVNVYGLFGFGVCGPAIAFLSRNVDVDRTNKELTLTFNDGLLMQAGGFIGAYAGAGVTLTLQVYKPQPWFKLWSATWRDAFSFNKDFKLDLLKLLFALIQYLLSKNSKNQFAEDSGDSLKDVVRFARTFSLIDTAGSFTGVRPNLTATPAMTLPINVANYFPSIKSINDSLAKIGGEISVGPSIGLEFPVKFNFDHFTVVGGLEGGATSADYGKNGRVHYVHGNQVSASGDTRFNNGVKPSQVTSHVRYETSFALALSFHFRVTVAKFFNIGANTPSLDLTYLLYGIRASDRTRSVINPVSTDVQGGCVLTPNMTLAFTGSNGPGTDFETGQTLRGTITLPGYRSSEAAEVKLEIEPPVAGFPARVTIPAGSQSAFFDFKFQNQCMATGNRNDPSKTTPPSPISPVETYLVSANLQSPSNNPCSDYEVETSLNITERFLRCQRHSSAPPGPAPPWDPLASAAISAGINGPGPHAIVCVLWFPLNGEPVLPVPITFTLLDENRQPHAGSETSILSDLGQRVALRPSATLPVTLRGSYSEVPSILLEWRSGGPSTGYSNRFYLIVDAGCQYGQTEFWLDVSNWS